MSISVKELVAKGNRVSFVKYSNGELWYEVINDNDSALGFEFPVPIAEAGTATFLATDKALLFMRYIRKHLEMLQKAKDKQNEKCAPN